VFVEVVTAKESGDCSIASLAMWTGKPYAQVVGKAPRRAYDVGMTNKEILDTARRLGCALTASRRFQLHEDSGILTLLPIRKKGSHHAVVLLDGHVIDPSNGRIWPDPDVYLQVERYRPGVLLQDGDA